MSGCCRNLSALHFRGFIPPFISWQSHPSHHNSQTLLIFPALPGRPGFSVPLLPSVLMKDFTPCQCPELVWEHREDLQLLGELMQFQFLPCPCSILLQGRCAGCTEQPGSRARSDFSQHFKPLLLEANNQQMSLCCLENASRARLRFHIWWLC